ncbi:Kinesin-like protein KIN-7O [Linum grandiflorum]
MQRVRPKMERIHVTVRARPLSSEDAKSSPWRVSGNSVYIPNHSSKFEFGTETFSLTHFILDRVFGEDSKTEEIYRARTRDIVAAAIRGFNGTVFAYGQTNSGKTHTMRGSADELGVIPLAVHDIFNIIHEDVGREFLLRMSYLEIYNEDINDLLAPEHRKLQIHENLERGIYVAGLREEIVTSPQQVLDFMQFGEAHRHIGETNMNVYSSRSHTIFRMIIESRDRTEDADMANSCDAVRVSVLNLVDLAGSERAAKTGAEGVRLKEGSHINKSLMTLGTVIKKLSEGAESQGGHVPYRDSKLTRILQPALGGNANTAIICNITLAQIHADETKSSLQFSSRALRIKNCACVNEVLTDAALLKRQKKEIEELRAKLMGSHSEHLEDEILSLRNTLLQSELERERVTLELEEEKRAQAEREKLLQEQAKKIESLSSMVLYSSREDNCNQLKKGKRRDTWCPSNFSRVALQEVDADSQSRLSTVKPMRGRSDLGQLVSFDELVSEEKVGDDLSQPQPAASNSASDDCTLPDPRALLHVTNRRKGQSRKKASIAKDHDLSEIQEEYEELLLDSETQRTVSEVLIDCLRRQLVDSDNSLTRMQSDLAFLHDPESGNHKEKNISMRESEAILIIKQLQEKIEMLEMDKNSSQQNLDSVVDIVTEQSLNAREKFEELHQELDEAREEARVASEQRDAGMSDLRMEIEEIASEVQEANIVVQTTFSLLEEAFLSLSMISDVFSDFRKSMLENSDKQNSIINNHAELCDCIRQKLTVAEDEKLLLTDKCADLERHLQQVRQDAQKQEDGLAARLEDANCEKEEYISRILNLEKEVSNLSSCSLAKEKENLRKDLEKTRTRLKEIESKLKNVVQEKTKLEGEKVLAEKEVKRLHDQKNLLQRDIGKRDSVMERSSKVGDPRKAKGLMSSFDQTMQEEYRNLEVLASNMEEAIASLEEELEEERNEKKLITQRSEDLASELATISERFNASNDELCSLQQEILGIRLKLEASTSDQQEMENSIKLLLQEKEDLALQLSDSLLEMEEEKAIWFSKEKASLAVIEEKTKLHNEEITALHKALSEVQGELESCQEEYKVLKETLSKKEDELAEKCSESSRRSNAESDRHQVTEQPDSEIPSGEPDSNNDENVRLEGENLATLKDMDAGQQLVQDLEVRPLSNHMTLHILIRDDHTPSPFRQNLQSQLDIVKKEKESMMEGYQRNAAEAECVREHYDKLLKGAKAQIEELSRRIVSLEAKMQSDYTATVNEKTKLRMLVRGTQAEKDAFAFRYRQVDRESEVMHKKFKEASKTLKEQLAFFAKENLELKKQLISSSSSSV